MPPRRQRKAEQVPRGLTPAETISGAAPAEIDATRGQIEADGGVVLGSFRDPLGGHWQVLASLPIDKVEPTPFQRDLSDTHVKRLDGVIDTLGRLLDHFIDIKTS